MKAQSTEAYEDLRKGLSEQILRSSQAWNALSDLLDKREQSQQHLALQVHLQSQELATIQVKAKEDGERMSGLYAKARAEAKKMWDAQKEAQKKADYAERERKASDRRMRKDFERKFKEFTRALQTKLSDERTK